MKSILRHSLAVLYCMALSAAIASADAWTEKQSSPETGGYGEAVIGNGDYIYIIKCDNATTDAVFWRYNPMSNAWTNLSVAGLPTGVFRNGTAVAWDTDENLYVLAGARYSDPDRREFYRYSLSDNLWSRRTDSPSPQGAGDAIIWSGFDQTIYAIMGSSNDAHGMRFATYNPESDEWMDLPDPPDRVDDGCSLAWTGGTDLFALRGEYYETSPLRDFWRYRIPEETWSDMADIPDAGGVGDGGSLLWIGSWMPEYSDFIYALGGGSCYEDPGYEFYRYSIAENVWIRLADLPNPQGYFNGCRLGYAQNHIYYWQGLTPGDDGGGNRFYKYDFVAEQTPTPTPARTSTPMPSRTPTPTPAASHPSTATPTPSGCETTGVSLAMSSHVFYPDDVCTCRVTVCNATAEELRGLPLFVILDVFGQYYFAPSFSDFDHYLDQYGSFPAGETEIVVFSGFIWPSGVGRSSGIVFHAALTDPGMTRVVGKMDSWIFGWSE